MKVMVGVVLCIIGAIWFYHALKRDMEDIKKQEKAEEEAAKARKPDPKYHEYVAPINHDERRI